VVPAQAEAAAARDRDPAVAITWHGGAGVIKILLILAGVILVMTGLSMAQDGDAVAGAILAGSPVALVVFAPLADAVLAWHDGRRQRLPRAIVRRRAS
jgi:hypothetical protein